MSDFDLDELRRLSAAATSGPYGYTKAQGDIFNGGGDQVGRSDDEHGPLLAYLGTHRDRIIAMLAAADALAEAGTEVAYIIPELSSCPDQYIALAEWDNALARYRAAKGGAK